MRTADRIYPSFELPNFLGETSSGIPQMLSGVLEEGGGRCRIAALPSVYRFAISLAFTEYPHHQVPNSSVRDAAHAATAVALEVEHLDTDLRNSSLG